MTALAGLPVCLDLAKVMELRESIERHLHVREGDRVHQELTQDLFSRWKYN